VPAEPAAPIEAYLLGNAQDAGVPQAGCECARCERARQDAGARRFAACLALVHHLARQFWFLDATPDFRRQLSAVMQRLGGYTFAGIALTHAHVGHYTGLAHLGREGWNVRGLPVFASEKMLAFLAANQPWAAILRDNLAPVRLAPATSHELAPGLNLVPVRVPHRDEFTDTLAFIIQTSQTKLFYCPDIDGWDNFPLEEMLRRVDHALLDGTFFSADELPGRDISEIPHPLARDTARRAGGRGSQVWLIHLNHTNPLHDPGPERAEIEAQGVSVGEQGQRWALG
jgi:pyrroloquinoline quinone biosynthesis protein B